jgi:hypothetical protein
MKLPQDIHYNYRLSEIIFNPTPYPKNLKHIISEHFPNSIAANYINLIKSYPEINESINKLGNHSIHSLNNLDQQLLFSIFKILKQSISQSFPEIILSKQCDRTSIHCRVGDVIDCCQNHSVSDHLKNSIDSADCCDIKNDQDTPLSIINKNSFYVRPASYFSSLKLSGNVFLVCGGCFSSFVDHQKSLQYINSVTQFLSTKNINLNVRYNNCADSDFLFMIQSKKFVSSSGRFSELISYFRKFLF